MDITVVGAGYAGLVAAACFSDLGHQVTSLDSDREIVERLARGETPIFEPGLEDLLASARDAGRIRFCSDYADLDLGQGSLVFLVVGTPGLPDDTFDVGALESAVRSLVPHLVDGVTIVVKSTVPVGEARRILGMIRTAAPDLDVAVASNPEFLRQGAAVRDFMEPDRIVIGADDRAVVETVRRAYAGVAERGAPVVETDLESAELIKYASNAFLATKLSFINEMSDLCETAGGSIDDIALGIGLDSRIGPAFLRPGPGFGGSCLPKDTAALRTTSRSHGTSSRVVHAALEVNRARVLRMSDRILGAASRERATIGMLGITFKAGTDDVRESPAVAIAAELARRGATVRIHDPHGMENAAEVLDDAVEFVGDEYAAATGADALVIATEWPQFADLDFERVRASMAEAVIVDLRRMLDPVTMATTGIRYLTIGRPDPA